MLEFQCITGSLCSLNLRSQSRGGHIYMPCVTIYDRDQNILIDKIGLGRLIFGKNYP